MLLHCDHPAGREPTGVVSNDSVNPGEADGASRRSRTTTRGITVRGRLPLTLVRAGLLLTMVISDTLAGCAARLTCVAQEGSGCLSQKWHPQSVPVIGKFQLTPCNE